VDLPNHANGEPGMASKKENAVYKIIEIVGTSNVSFGDAAKNGVKAASKSLRDLRVAEVEKLDVRIDRGGKITYRAKLKVGFKYHGED
jgi:flavin-binding protein dodecin